MSRMSVYAANLREALEARLQPVEGGPLDGNRILTAGDVEEAIKAAALPPPDEHAADLAEPAQVNLTAECHFCHEHVPVGVRLESYAKARANATTVGFLAIGSPVTHVCGQTMLPLGDASEAEGQTSWTLPPARDLGTVEGRLLAMLAKVGLTMDPAKVADWSDPECEAAEHWAVAAHVASRSVGETIPEPPAHVTAAIMAAPAEPCPTPYCVKDAEHPGRHKYRKPEPEPEPVPEQPGPEVEPDPYPEEEVESDDPDLLPE